jgi:hypothetical protein
MATTLYIICAALGGVLLVSSLFGDHHHGQDTSHDGAWFSLRGVTYFLGFFGFTGVALRLLTDAPAFVIAGSSVGVGLAAAGLASVIINRLMAENRAGGGTLKNADIIGREATVVIAFERGGTGRVVLNGLSSTVEMLCVSEDATFTEGEQVLIVDSQKGVATITKLSGAEKK